MKNLLKIITLSAALFAMGNVAQANPGHGQPPQQNQPAPPPQQHANPGQPPHPDKPTGILGKLKREIQKGSGDIRHSL